MAEKTTLKQKKRNLKRNFWMGVLIALAVYIGLQFLSRTEGVRSLVIDKISNGTRLPVTLERCAATPLLGLRLKTLDFYGASMPDVRIQINFLAFLSRQTPWIKQISIQDMEVKFQRVPGGKNWAPLVLHGIGNKLGAVLGLNALLPTDEAPLTFPVHVINERTQLRLQHAKIVWLDEQNQELAYITDIDTHLQWVALSKRKALQTHLTCGHIKLASGKMLRDFQLEALQIEGYSPTLIFGMSDSDGAYDGFQTDLLWHELNLRLNALSDL